MSDKISTYVHRRQVQFSETDMAGIVHFAQFYRYMEEAEHAFLRSVGLSVMMHNADGSILGWPRVRCQCGFKAPAFFEDQLDIEVRVQRIGVKSLTLDFIVTRDDGPEANGGRPTLIAEGSMKTVACTFTPDRKMTSVPVPEAFLSRVEEAGE
ncbi:acyl-CoA thioesterase [Alienimonas californiensis]|uniref:1,4-dihydroxy-2-naphthoyl-CoA hydrolase n=1 Tax=Alienimonas californiensis TaxID=2527989 RepID=A0A517P7R2_9PLAN|nr:acyl-CoA thioesterase [Alienimonas californiensis]QDT15411.1 1,4-dihydroxy-2-naphthoyl-CoA hydrolase [Alienimonas californiensis]